MDLDEYISKISYTPRSTRREVLLNQRNTNKPTHSFGKLEHAGYRLAEIIGCNKKTLEATVIVFAGDHGVAELDLSVFPKEHTKKVVNLLNTHQLPIHKIVDTFNIPLNCYDIGIDGKVEYSEIVHNVKIDCGTKNMIEKDAIGTEKVRCAIEKGIKVAEECFEKGIKIAALGEIGICNTVATSVLTAILCDLTEDDVTDRGTGIQNEKLVKKRECIKKLIADNKQYSSDVITLLSKVGGYEICGDIGFILGCAYNGIPIVIDGYITGIAALVAYRLQPNIRKFVFPSHLSAEKGHKYIMKEMGQEPFIDFGMKYGLATGAAMALPIYIMAYKLVNK